jgi:hypothetical protein
VQQLIMMAMAMVMSLLGVAKSHGNRQECAQPTLPKLRCCHLPAAAADRNSCHQRVFNYLQRAKLSCGRVIRLLTHPLPSESCLSFAVFLGVVGRAYRRERGEMGVSEEPNHTTAIEPGPP